MSKLVTFTLALSLSACAGSAQDTGRWKPYAGCNEQQCRSWNSGCEADCLNQKGADSDLCMNQCKAKLAECTPSCI